MQGIEKLNDLFTTTTQRATALGDAMASAFERGTAAATAAIREVDALAAAMNRASEAAGNFGRASGGMGGGGEPPFDEGDYERPPSGRRGQGLLGFGSGALVDREMLQSRGYGGGGGYGGAAMLGGGGRLLLGDGTGFGGRIPDGPDEDFDGGGGRRRGGGGHIAPFVEAAALYEAMKAGASEEQAVDIALVRGFHMDPRTATDEQKNYLRTLARQGSEGTSFSEREVAGGLVTLAAPLGFTGPEGMKQFGSVFEVAAKAAEAAKQLHFGSFEGTLQGSVEFAHQMQLYDAPGLTRGLNLLGKVTESLPGGDMEREAQVMSYAIPQARALGADPEQAMSAVGFLQRAGLRNTVAATTLRQMLVGQLKTGGPMNAQHRQRDHDRRELEDSLGLTPGHLERPAAGKTNAHEEALIALGLVDKSGKNLDLNAKGGFDIDKMFELIATKQGTMSPVDFGKAMFNAFGIRGQTGGELIGEALPQYRTYQKNLASTPDLPEQLKMVSGNSAQLTGQAMARAADVGNDIGTILLPALNAFDNVVISIAGHIRQFIGDHPGETAAGLAVGIPATMTAGWMGMRGLLGKVGSFFHEGTAAAGTSALQGGAGSIMRSGIGGGLIAGLGAEAATDWFLSSLGDKLTDMVYGKGTSEKWRKEEIEAEKRYRDNPQIVAGPRVGVWGNRGADTTTPAAPAAPAQITVHINNTMNGVADEGTFRGLLDKFTASLKDTLTHVTSDAHGSSASVYTFPGGL